MILGFEITQLQHGVVVEEDDYFDDRPITTMWLLLRLQSQPNGLRQMLDFFPSFQSSTVCAKRRLSPYFLPRAQVGPLPPCTAE